MTERKFYDLNVVFGEENGPIIERAKKLGLSGICLVHTCSDGQRLEEYLTKLDQLRGDAGPEIELISGVLLKGANLEKIAKEIRRRVDVILASGGDYEINRMACSSDYIDILCHPEKGRRDCGIDHICCKEARDHNTLLEINFREILVSQAGQRIKKLNQMKEILRLCLKTKSPFIVNSGAREMWELRGGRELSSVSYALGAQLYPALVSNSELSERLVKLNREKKRQPLSGVYIESGGDYEG